MASQSVPIIDIAPFRRGSPAERRDVARAVDAACRDIGFIVVAGHGVSEHLVAAAQRVAKQFFALPLKEKLKVKRRPPAFNRGYGPLEEEGLGKSLGVAAPADKKETLSIGPVDLPDDPYFHRPEAFPHFAVNQWPERPAELRPVMTRYFKELERLAADLMQIFAVGLELPANYFADKIDKQCGSLRALWYPEQPEAPIPGQLRAGAHTDYGSLTILKTEDAPGGLQVRRRDGEWINVDPVPGCFIINIGDLMMHWTNDRWVSTLHRVVNPPRDHALGSCRLSLAFFHQPNYDAEIRCLDTCQGPGNPAKYPPTTSGAHRLYKLNRANDYEPVGVS